MIAYSLTLFFVSLFGTVYVFPHSVRKLRENGYLAYDMYKPEKPRLPTNAGIIILFVSYMGIALVSVLFSFIELLEISPFEYYELSDVNLVFILVVLIFCYDY